MRIDWYTKGVLTVIAVLLAVIAFKQYVSPDAVVQAQATFAGVQLVENGGLDFFDNRTGEIWSYAGTGQYKGKFKVTRVFSQLLCTLANLVSMP